MKATLTHKGWFGLCPVYFAGLETEAPLILPRHWLLGWLMMLSEGIYGIAMRLRAAADPAYEPAWPLTVTGELVPPKVKELPDAT